MPPQDMPTYYGGIAYSVGLVKGMYAVGSERYAYGLCPTCQTLNDSEVDARFAELRRKNGPGKKVNKIQLFSFYGVGSQPPVGWEFYWPRMEAWRHGR